MLSVRCGPSSIRTIATTAWQVCGDIIQVHDAYAVHAAPSHNELIACASDMFGSAGKLPLAISAVCEWIRVEVASLESTRKLYETCGVRCDQIEEN